MKLIDLALIFVVACVSFTGGGLLHYENMVEAHRIAARAQEKEAEYKRLWCASSEGRISVVCQSDKGIIRPSLDAPVRAYRRIEI